MAVSACLQYMRWIAVVRALRPCPAPPHGSERGGQVRRGNSGGKRRSGQGENGNWFPARYVRMGASKKQVGHNSKYVRPVSKYLGHISAPVETRRQYVAEVRMKRGRMPAARPRGERSAVARRHGDVKVGSRTARRACGVRTVRVVVPLRQKTRKGCCFSNNPCIQSGATRNRTGDTRIFSPLLYHLSYGTFNCDFASAKIGFILISSKFIGKNLSNMRFVCQKVVTLHPQVRKVAQLVAHYVRDVGVGRSNRLFPT